MSVIDKLNELQEARHKNKYSQALHKSPLELAEKAVFASSPLETHITPFLTKTLQWILALLAVLVVQAGLIIGLLLRNTPTESKRIEAPVKSVLSAQSVQDVRAAPARTPDTAKSSRNAPAPSKKRSAR